MIIFRANGNSKIGSGHIMRCLSLADAFSKLKYECCFILGSDDFKLVIEAKGYKTFVLYSKFDEMENELVDFQCILNDVKPSVIIVDSYFVTSDYLKILKNHCKVAYIDDLTEFAYPCDVLINYNLFAKEIDYKQLYGKANVEYPTILAGARYAPMREEFQNIAEREIPTKCNNILLSTGGTDLVHIAKQFVDYLCDNNLNSGYIFHIVIGAMNADSDYIYEKARNNLKIVLHKNVRDMKSLMMDCDIAVSAGGTTLFELCACGLPTITYILADNQILNVNAFFNFGLMDTVGDIRGKSDVPSLIYNEIDKLDNEYARRKCMSRSMMEMIDGHGANNIAKDIIKMLNIKEK